MQVGGRAAGQLRFCPPSLRPAVTHMRTTSKEEQSGLANQTYAFRVCHLKPSPVGKRAAFRLQLYAVSFGVDGQNRRLLTEPDSALKEKGCLPSFEQRLFPPVNSLSSSLQVSQYFSYTRLLTSSSIMTASHTSHTPRVLNGKLAIVTGASRGKQQRLLESYCKVTVAKVL